MDRNTWDDLLWNMVVLHYVYFVSIVVVAGAA
jgi:hypothetical protein